MSGSPQQLAQPRTEWAAAAANGQLTFTTVGPRRGSITISSEATGELCTSTGTNAVFAGIALAALTARVTESARWARFAATTQRRNKLAFKRWSSATAGKRRFSAG